MASSGLQWADDDDDPTKANSILCAFVKRATDVNFHVVDTLCADNTHPCSGAHAAFTSAARSTNANVQCRVSLSGVGTTCFPLCSDKDLAIIFTITYYI
jgi:hypothetical protein